MPSNNANVSKNLLKHFGFPFINLIGFVFVFARNDDLTGWTFLSQIKFGNKFDFCRWQFWMFTLNSIRLIIAFRMKNLWPSRIQNYFSILVSFRWYFLWTLKQYTITTYISVYVLILYTNSLGQRPTTMCHD